MISTTNSTTTAIWACIGPNELHGLQSISVDIDAEADSIVSKFPPLAIRTIVQKAAKSFNGPGNDRWDTTALPGAPINELGYHHMVDDWVGMHHPGGDLFAGLAKEQYRLGQSAVWPVGSGGGGFAFGELSMMLAVTHEGFGTALRWAQVWSWAYFRKTDSGAEVIEAIRRVAV